MNKKLFLFDFDGTLVDSMPTYVGMLIRILDDDGIDYPCDVVKTVTPLGKNGTAQYYVDNFPMKCIKEQFLKKMENYVVDDYLYRIQPKPYVKEVLWELKRKGAFLNVLTASPHNTLDPCLKRTGLYGLFDNVWSCDDFETTKADPDIYVRAAAAMGAEVTDIIFLDDNYDADLCAKKTGAKVIGVYDDSSKDYEEDMRRICDGYIYDFRALLQ